MVYKFDEQQAKGRDGEQFLDHWFADWYEIRPATCEEQRQGIDRIFIRRQTGKRLAIEYKTDYRAAQTGNAFVETVSVDTADKAGWAYSAEADYLLYYIPGDSLVYVMTLEILRRELPRWVREYPHRAAQNKGYATHGVLVPLHEFERHAEVVLNV
jgi:hypothetical protein